jgi:hypothetical protein
MEAFILFDLWQYFWGHHSLDNVPSFLGLTTITVVFKIVVEPTPHPEDMSSGLTY